MLNIEAALRGNLVSFYAKYPAIITKPVTHFFKKLFHEEEINSFLMRTPVKNLAFVNRVLEEKNVSYEVKSREIENIPAIGRVIVVSNHPLGGMDSFVMLKLIGEARQDRKVKIIANEILMQIDATRELLIPVNNMDGKVSKDSHRQIVEALENEEAVIFFPAGEVSRASMTGIKDEKWKNGFLRIAKLTKSPILPVYIDAKNSWLFYFLSWIYRPLGGLLLAHEMVKPSFRDIGLTIGELIPVEAFDNRSMSLREYTKLFKKHLYRISKHKSPIFMTQKCIAHPQQRQLLKQELKEARRLGKTSDEKSIYLLEYDKSPSMMQEIGRLREFSFRKVGEGTGQKSDIDTYDRYYKHIVLWDEDALEIVGAYRIGEAKMIRLMHGNRGLYMNKLCTIRSTFDEVGDNAIELGRSFVQPKYWSSRALDYLWQGIGAYLREHPEVRYMYGPVSISNNYPKAARDALVYFYRNYFGATTHYFQAFESYTITTQIEDELSLIFDGSDYKKDLITLKEYLKNFDVAIPTLYKQYSELCEVGGASFSDFGIDANFGECLDGYILVDITKIKPKKYERYVGGVVEESANAA
ncbi:MAG: acyltransferase [Sulfuricurvum sp. PC08-66]|nr:MAG: acyltransferase [Sulfuricurvum sp. PC08-66]